MQSTPRDHLPYRDADVEETTRRLRAIGATLPEVSERVSHGAVTFFVRGSQVGKAKWARTMDGRRQVTRLLRTAAARVREPLGVILATREHVDRAPADATVLTAARVFS